MPTIAPQMKPSRTSSISARASETSRITPSALKPSSTNGAVSAALQLSVKLESRLTLKISSTSGVFVYIDSVVAAIPPQRSAAARMLTGSRSYMSSR